MKKILIALLILIVLLFGSLIAIPYFFKDEIVDTLKKEMSDQMDAQLNFEKVSITLFKNFPELSLEVSEFSLETNDSSTSVKMGRFYFSMESMSYFSDGAINITNIVFEKPEIRYLNSDTATLVENDAELNESNNAASDASSDEELLIRLNRLQIVNANIHYADSAMKMVADLKDFNLEVSGNFSESLTDISIASSLGELLFVQEGVTLVNDLPASLNADIAANLEAFSFTLKENNLKLGSVDLKLDGTIAEIENGWNMDLQFDAPGMNMKKLLTMIPAAYASSVEGLKTDGNIALSGTLKGVYTDMEHVPGFNIGFVVDDGYFQYPDLPESVKNIKVKAAISHPNNQNLDATVVVVDQFECYIGSNPIQSQWTFKTPVSDLNIDGFLKGNLDLASLKNVFPMENTQMEGKVVADVKLKGNMSAIEKDLYDQFYAAGYMQLSDFKYTSNDFPQGVLINKASMDFTPERINLKNFTGKMGRSDISLSGYLTNYISYVFQDGTLQGRLNHSSNVIDANEFLDGEDSGEAETDTISSLLIIPDKLNLVFTSDIQNLYFDNLHITACKGKISVNNRIASLDKLNMKLLSGTMLLSGQYNSKDTTNVFSDMQLVINNIDIAEGVDAFSSIRKIAPITHYAEGKISLDLSYLAPFDDKGEILMDQLASKGFLSSNSIHVKNNATLDQLAKTTNNPKYKDLRTNAFKANYIIENGKVIVLPFKVTVEDKKMEIWGNHTMNNIMDYSIKTTIAPNELGDQIGGVLQLIADPKKQLPVTVRIKGDVKKPGISIDTKEALKELQKNAGGILKGLF